MKVILTTLLLCTFLTGHGQKKIKLFDDFNFSSGKYLLLCTKSLTSPPVQDGLEYFYIDDIPTLIDIQKNWKFKLIHDRFNNDCNENYNLDICLDGESQIEYNIEIDCNRLLRFTNSFDDDYSFIYNYDGCTCFFDKEYLISYSDKFQKAFRKEDNFHSIQEARKYLENILNDENLILAEEPLWTDFEGAFVIKFQINSIIEKSYVKTEKNALTQLSKELNLEYPNEQFQLENIGLGDKEMIVNIWCNKTLADKFDLYPIDCCEFKFFEPILTTYWKRE